MLRIPEGNVDIEAPLTSQGMDSLMGLELRNRIETVLGIKVSATLLWTYATVVALSGHLAKILSPAAAAIHDMEPEGAKKAEEEAAAIEDLQALTDEEKDALLSQQMARLEKLIGE